MILHRHRLAKIGRAVIAIAAAYAFVLQVLLLSLMASQAATAAPASLSYATCFGSTDGSHDPAADKTTPAKAIHCSLLCAQAMAADVPPPPAVLLGLALANSTPLSPPPMPAVNVRASPSPKLSQGPPQIA
jgi:hypothetical protein